MLSVIVFVLANGLAPVPTTEEGIAQWRLNLPPKIVQYLTARFVGEVTTTLWGRGSFVALASTGREAQAMIGDVHVTTFGGDLAHPFDLGRGFTCGVGVPPQAFPRW